MDSEEFEVRKNVAISIVRNRALDIDDWRRLLRIQSRFSGLQVDRYGSHEPISKKFSADRIDQILDECWNRGPTRQLIWRSKGDAFGGRMGTQFSVMPGFSRMSVWNGNGKLPESLEFLNEFAREISADGRCMFGLVHMLSKEEVVPLGQGGALAVTQLDPDRQKYSIGVSPMVLRRWIPDLFWGNIFGPPYVDLFGRDRLISAPCHSVREFAPSTIYMQLTGSIYDMVDRFNSVRDIREGVKRHLGIDAFWRADAPKDQKYLVPRVYGV